MQQLFHIVDRTEWAAAVQAGEYRPSSLAAEGFVHFSFAHQVSQTANLRFRGRADLCVVEVDPALLPVPVVVEDSYGSGTEFPHVYAPIPVSAAVAVHPLEPGPEGAFSFHAPGGTAPASRDR